MMQILIDIPEEVYEKQRYSQYFGAWSVVLQKCFENGTPLPKGHGRLIDADALIKSTDKEEVHMYEIALAQTIIEADKAESELPSIQPKEPCDDAISRVFLKEAFHNFFQGLKHSVTEEDVQAYIDAAPSVKPVACIARVEFDEVKMKEIAEEAAERIVEECEDAISRNNAITSICQWGTTLERVGKLTLAVAEVKQTCTDILTELPSVRPKERTGHWIEPIQDDGMSDPIYYQVRCSECGKESGYNPFGASRFSDFCPNCGAKMEESEE